MAVDDEISTAERPDVDFRQHLGSFVVASRYGNKLWIVVLEAYEENFNFLHPNGINPSYQFPEKKDECHIKAEDVLGLLPPPNLRGGSHIKAEDVLGLLPSPNLRGGSHIKAEDVLGLLPPQNLRGGSHIKAEDVVGLLPPPNLRGGSHIKPEDVLGLLPPPNLRGGSRIQYTFNIDILWKLVA